MSTTTVYTYAQHTSSAGRIAFNAELDATFSEGEELSDDYIAHTGTRAELIAEARDDLARKYDAGPDIFHHRTARSILHHLDAPLIPEYMPGFGSRKLFLAYTFDGLVDMIEVEREADPTVVDPARLHIRPDGHVGILGADTIFATCTDKE